MLREILERATQLTMQGGEATTNALPEGRRTAVVIYLTDDGNEGSVFLPEGEQVYHREDVVRRMIIDAQLQVHLKLRQALSKIVYPGQQLP